MVVPGLEGEVLAFGLLKGLGAGLVVAQLPQRKGLPVDVPNAVGHFSISIDDDHLLRRLGFGVEEALEGFQVVDLVFLGARAALVEDKHLLGVTGELRQRNHPLIADALGKAPPLLQDSQVASAKVDNLMQASNPRGSKRVLRELVPLVRDDLPLPEPVADR